MNTTIFNSAAGASIGPKENRLLIFTGFFLITFYLPVFPIINNIAILSLTILCLFFNSWREKLRLLKQRPAIFIITLFYLLLVISAFTSIDEAKGMQYLQVRIPLLLFPLTLGLIQIKPAVKIRVYLLYAVITTLAACFCLVSALIVYNRTGDSGFIYNDSLTEAIGKQSSYFALMVNLAIFSYSYLLIKNYITRSFKKVVIILIAFLMIIHFLLASRMEISLLYGAAIAFALYHFFVKTKNRRAGFIMIGGLVFCAAIFVYLFPKTINRFNELLYPNFNYKSNAVESHYNGTLTPDQWNGLNIRLAIWSCGFEIVKRHPLMGVSVGDKDQALLDVFKEKGFNFGIRTNKNMHSTYLDILASMGIIGLLVFLAGYLVLPIISCFRFHDVLGGLVLTDFILTFISETYPDRSMGCVIFGFFVAFIMSYKNDAQPGIHYQPHNA